MQSFGVLTWSCSILLKRMWRNNNSPLSAACSSYCFAQSCFCATCVERVVRALSFRRPPSLNEKICKEKWKRIEVNSQHICFFRHCNRISHIMLSGGCWTGSSPVIRAFFLHLSAALGSVLFLRTGVTSAGLLCVLEMLEQFSWSVAHDLSSRPLSLSSASVLEERTVTLASVDSW